MAGCGGGDEAAVDPPAGNGSPTAVDLGPVHVHGLGIDPGDGALLIATHTGLFRSPPGAARARRVGESHHDLMGFTVAGPDRYVASGHPDGTGDLPPFLGLIESQDGGRTWESVSLLGEVDFHVLEAVGRRIYGFGSHFETRAATMLVSDDGGRTWAERSPPEALLDLAIDPADADRAVASGEDGLFITRDAGRTWRPLDGPAGLLTWAEPDALYAVAGDGAVSRSQEAGRTFEAVGQIPGQPAAFHGESTDELYAALHEGTVLESRDGGASWRVRSHP